MIFKDTKNDLMQSITWVLSPPKGEEEEEEKEEEGRRVRKFRLSRKFPRLEQKKTNNNLCQTKQEKLRESQKSLDVFLELIFPQQKGGKEFLHSM